ncbi:hypothetical protein [Actinomadura madurae]|uniref:hypothetical protein n=1 Tax=Actinomadura madurae TaxID=1993 RepID=UPI0020D250C9|nr:hypothetical protein [Actinomadura madurae]MCQ0012456.1 hypothetical protein [Actinomadura madurae]
MSRPALPGIALLRSGRVRCGSALLAGQALALAAAALAAGHVPPAGPVWPAAATAGLRAARGAVGGADRPCLRRAGAGRAAAAAAPRRAAPPSPSCASW